MSAKVSEMWTKCEMWKREIYETFKDETFTAHLYV